MPSVAEAYTAAARRQGVSSSRRKSARGFSMHFQNGRESTPEQGLLSTDEATERRRWRQIVAGVLPEVPTRIGPSTSCGTTSAARSRGDASRTSRPRSARLADAGISICVGSNFDGRLRGVVRGLARAGSVRRFAWSFRRKLVIANHIRSSFRPLATTWACPRDQVLCVGDDLENDVRGAIRAGFSGILLDRGGNRPADLPSCADPDGLGRDEVRAETPE